MSEKKGIVFPILNGLAPTVESCTAKVLEEVGELFQLIGKHKGASGEEQTMLPRAWAIRTAFESLDVAQSAITLAQTICKKNGLNLEYMMQQHEDKLSERGCLVEIEPVEKILQTEVKCRQCQYSFMSGEELAFLGYDPCETCIDLNNWKQKSDQHDG